MGRKSASTADRQTQPSPSPFPLHRVLLLYRKMTYTSGFVIPTPASQYRMQLRAADRHATPNNNNRRTMSGTCLEFDPIPEPPVDLYMPYISPYRPIPSHAHSPSRDGSPVLQSRGRSAARHAARNVPFMLTVVLQLAWIA